MSSNHLTLAEAGQRLQLSQEEVIQLCKQLSVPVLRGRVDWALLQMAKNSVPDPGS
jgi:hypothetical protein